MRKRHLALADRSQESTPVGHSFTERRADFRELAEALAEFLSPASGVVGFSSILDRVNHVAQTGNEIVFGLQGGDLYRLTLACVSKR